MLLFADFLIVQLHWKTYKRKIWLTGIVTCQTELLVMEEVVLKWQSPKILF